MNRSLLSVVTAVLNYAPAFELHNGISIAEARAKNIVGSTMSSHYHPNQSYSSCVGYMRFSRLMTRNTDVLR